MSVQLTSVLAASNAHVRDVKVLTWDYYVRNILYVKDSTPNVIGDSK